MIEMRMRVPDALAPKLQRMDRWLPIVLELSLAGFKTRTAQTVAEVIDFLAKGPAPKQVAAYKVSARANAFEASACPESVRLAFGRRTGRTG